MRWPRPAVPDVVNRSVFRLPHVKLSIVIPTLNEEASVPRLLPHIAGKANEIFVVDGESTDRTLEVAKKFPAQLISSPRGRGLQMNAGACRATGDFLWFLHADTVLPTDWRQQLLAATSDSKVVGGGFRVVIDGKGLPYRLLDAWGWFRTSLEGTFYGDQGIFVRRDVFHSLGGFSEGSGPEDLDFSTRLNRFGKTAYLPGPLVTSARRWQMQGWWRTVFNHSLSVLSYEWDPSGCAPTTLVIIAKAPLPGTVKTRLVPPLTHEQAAGLARGLLQENAALVGRLESVQKVVAVAPAQEILHVREIVGDRFRIISQSNGNLGDRIRRIFRVFFAEGSRGVIVLAADQPDLPAQYLHQAVAALQEGSDQVVLGPTEDGGYYLIGLNRNHPELFQGISWSTCDVLRQTLDRAKSRGLTVTLLPSWYDIDRPEDLARLPARFCIEYNLKGARS